MTGYGDLTPENRWGTSAPPRKSPSIVARRTLRWSSDILAMMTHCFDNAMLPVTWQGAMQAPRFTSAAQISLIARIPTGYILVTLLVCGRGAITILKNKGRQTHHDCSARQNLGSEAGSFGYLQNGGFEFISGPARPLKLLLFVESNNELKENFAPNLVRDAEVCGLWDSEFVTKAEPLAKD